MKDTQNQLDAQAIIAGDKDHSMTWLHYAIVDEEQAEEDNRVSTMILAQYFYKAQENCNRLLKQAIDSAYNSNNRTLTEKRLSFARVVTRLHLIDLNEHKKFYKHCYVLYGYIFHTHHFYQQILQHHFQQHI